MFSGKWFDNNCIATVVKIQVGREDYHEVDTDVIIFTMCNIVLI